MYILRAGKETESNFTEFQLFNFWLGHMHLHCTIILLLAEECSKLEEKTVGDFSFQFSHCIIKCSNVFSVVLSFSKVCINQIYS